MNFTCQSTKDQILHIVSWDNMRVWRCHIRTLNVDINLISMRECQNHGVYLCFAYCTIWFCYAFVPLLSLAVCFWFLVSPRSLLTVICILAWVQSRGNIHYSNKRVDFVRTRIHTLSSINNGPFKYVHFPSKFFTIIKQAVVWLRVNDYGWKRKSIREHILWISNWKISYKFWYFHF